MDILKMFLPNGKIDNKYYQLKLIDELLSKDWNSWILPLSKTHTTTVDLEGGIITFKGPPPTLYTKKDTN